jgi:hypothetical protein
MVISAPPAIWAHLSTPRRHATKLISVGFLVRASFTSSAFGASLAHKAPSKRPACDVAPARPVSLDPLPDVRAPTTRSNPASNAPATAESRPSTADTSVNRRRRSSTSVRSASTYSHFGEPARDGSTVSGERDRTDSSALEVAGPGEPAWDGSTVPGERGRTDSSALVDAGPKEQWAGRMEGVSGAALRGVVARAWRGDAGGPASITSSRISIPISSQMPSQACHMSSSGRSS